MADPGCKTQRRAEPASVHPFSRVVYHARTTGLSGSAGRVRIPSVLRISHETTSARAGARRALPFVLSAHLVSIFGLCESYITRFGAALPTVVQPHITLNKQIL